MVNSRAARNWFRGKKAYSFNYLEQCAGPGGWLEMYSPMYRVALKQLQTKCHGGFFSA